jgi:NAD(P)-dependent dehydrogenase (short-subunit alcohol dehydrogenase family)
MLSSSARPSNSPYYGIGAFALFSPLAVLYTVASHLVLKCTGRLPEPLAISATITPSSNASVETETQIQRVAIVTGSNTGIGYETARALVLDHGMEVILACRSRDKAQAAADRIQQAVRTSAGTPSQRVGRAVVIHPLDLASPQSVLDFCAALKDKYTAVHVLVNNAGRNTSGKSPSGGNLDLLFASNFIGHFLLTSQIMPLLQAGGNARIVNVSSVMHHFCQSYGDLESVDFWKRVASANVPPHDTYSLSKLAAILFTIQLRSRYPDIHSIAVNPGAV